MRHTPCVFSDPYRPPKIQCRPIVFSATLWVVGVVMVMIVAYYYVEAFAPSTPAAGVPRPLRLYVDVRPDVDGRVLYVRAEYTLLEDWADEQIVVGLAARPSTMPRVSDPAGTLPARSPATRAHLVEVPLRSTKAGYAFTVEYEAATLDTGLHTMGRIWFPLGDTPREATVDWTVPGSAELRFAAGHGLQSPAQVLPTDDGTRARFIVDGRRDIHFQYEPATGLGMLADQVVQHTVHVDAGTYRFSIRYPVGAEEAVADVRGFLDTTFPRVVELAGGALPPAPHIDIALRSSLAPRPWVVAAYNAPQGVMTIYLRRLSRSPSTILAHELVHAYLLGEVPVYLEEGLADHVNNRLLWEAGILDWDSLAVFDDSFIDARILAHTGYSHDPSIVAEGYWQGSRLMDTLEALRREQGIDLPREMLQHLQTPGASLQSAICRSEHGLALYTVLAKHDLAHDLHPPSRCTAEVASGPSSPWPQPRGPVGEDTSAMAKGAVAGLVSLISSLGAPIVAIAAAWDTWQRLLASGYATRYLISRFAPALASGLLFGTVWPRMVAAVLWRALCRRHPSGPGRPRPSPWSHRHATNALVVSLALLALTIGAWGPSLFPSHCEIALRATGELYAQGMLLTSGLALIELRHAGQLP